MHKADFPGGTEDKTLPPSAGDMGSIPGPGRFHIPRSSKLVRHNSEAHVPRACAP